MNLQEWGGHNALMIAAMHCETAVAKAVIIAGTHLQQKAIDGKTAIDCASGYPEILDLLKNATSRK